MSVTPDETSTPDAMSRVASDEASPSMSTASSEDTLAVSILEALTGRRPNIAEVPTERLMRLLRPLLRRLDESIPAAGGPTSLPSKVRLARKFHTEQQRLSAYLDAMQADPAHTGFRPLYSDWIEQNPELAEAYRSGSWRNRELLAASSDGPFRVLPEFFCTVWAVQHSGGKGAGQDIDILAHLDESLVSFARLERDSKAAANEPARRQAAVASAEERTKRKLEQELARAGRTAEKFRRQAVREKVAKENGERQLAESQAQNQKLLQTQERNTARVRQADELAEKEIARREEIHKLLREERERARSLEHQTNWLSAKALDLEQQLQRLNQTIDSAPFGTRGINELYATQLQKEELLRDTAQGAVQQEAAFRFGRLKRSLDIFREAYPEFALEPRIRMPEKTKAPFRVRAFGGGDHVGASCYLLEIGDYRVLVDCGIRVNAIDIENLGPADVLELDHLNAVIVTHAHADHSGWLPALVATGLDFDVYCTAPTQALLRVMLEDSRRQLERQLAADQVKAKHTNRVPVAEPYDSIDLENTYLRVRPVEYEMPVQLGPGLEFKLFDAGHILGAASVLFEGLGRSIFFTGDFSTFAQLTMPPCIWPTDDHSHDLVITESTYGNRNRRDRTTDVAEFVDQIAETIAAGGTVLIPSFALGRAQEVLSIINLHMDSGRLPPVTVWIDGMIEKVNEIYRDHDSLSWNINFRQVKGDGYSRDEVVRECRANPGIIVSTSGMLTGGPIVGYASELLGDARNRILFCGYQDEEAPGYKLLKLSDGNAANRRVNVEDENGKSVTIVAAAPAKLFSLSAHSDQQQLVEAICHLRPDAVLPVHGDDEARNALAQQLRQRGINVTLDLDLRRPAE